MDGWIDSACDGLVRDGWFACADAIAPALVDALYLDLEELVEADKLKRAGIGREADFQVDRAIRGDWIYWLTRRREAESVFLDFAETLRLALNRRLFLALFEFEAHLAVYPPGAFYQRHFDSFRGEANRIVSLVIYLNRDWQPGDGGELLIYAADGAEPTRIEPRAGTLVLMMSEEIEHEVRVSRIRRCSVAGWYRLNTTTAELVDPPR